MSTEFERLFFFIDSAGGYVLDNFPRTREQSTSMFERNIVPDEVIYLKDDSDSGEFLLKRWYQTNKQSKKVYLIAKSNCQYSEHNVMDELDFKSKGKKSLLMNMKTKTILTPRDLSPA